MKRRMSIRVRLAALAQRVDWVVFHTPLVADRGFLAISIDCSSSRLGSTRARWFAACRADHLYAWIF
jgi:hypothetical protein